MNNTAVAQFQWLALNDTFYLYNTKSQIIIAAFKTATGGKKYIRLRIKSRYRHIVETWAKKFPDSIVMESASVGRWERRMRYLRIRDNFGRRDAIYHTYFQGSTVRWTDNLARRRNRRRNTRDLVEQLINRENESITTRRMTVSVPEGYFVRNTAEP